MSDVVLGIKIVTDGGQARAEIASINGELLNTEKAGRKAAQGIDSVDKSSRLAAEAAGRLAGIFSGITAVGIVTYIAKTAAEFDRLNASLRTVTGSAEGQAKAMDMIKSFAAETPYEIQQVTEAFIRLKSLGLDSSEKSLRSFGNTASAMGKPLMQFIEAVADASTNEFERLKEFGIKAKQEGETVTFTFRGVSTTVQNTSEAIIKYLRRIGETDFAGGMARQMDNITGKASNLADAISKLADSFATASGLRSGLKAVLDDVAASINRIRKEIELVSGMSKNAPVDALRLQMEDLQTRLNEMDNMRGKGFGGFVDDKIYERANEELRKTSELLSKLTSGAKEAGDSFVSVEAKVGNAGQKIENMSRRQIEVMKMVAAEAKRQGVEIALALAVAEQESSFNQSARANTKYGPAVGVMQLIPPTAQRLGLDATDVAQNIRGGVTELKRVQELLIKELGDAGRSFDLVAAGYFSNVNKIIEYVKKNKDLPGWTDGSKSVPGYSADIGAKVAKYRADEKTLTTVLDTELKERVKLEKDHYDAVEAMSQASAKAQETVEKSKYATEAALLAEQKKAYEDYVRTRSGELSGDAQNKFMEQATRQEIALIEQGVAIKEKAIDSDRRAAQSELQTIQARIAARSQLQLSETEVANLMARQKQVIADITSLDAQSASTRIQGAGELQQALAGVADIYAKNEAAAKSEAETRQEILSALDTQIAQLKGVAKGYEGVARAKALAASAGLPKDQQDAYMKEFDARVAMVNELTKANKKQAESEKAVADQVLRTGQYYNAMVQQAQNAAQGMVQAFGETGSAIGQLVVGLAQYQNTMFNIQQRSEALIEANRKAGGSADQEMEIRAQAMNQELTAQINNYGNLTQAAQGFFDKGTSGYQAMENATKVFRAVELAMTLANYAQMAVAGVAHTQKDVAQAAIRGQAKATEAVAAQATVPVAGFAMAAAMAAMMAAIGFGVAGATSSGAPRGAVSRSGNSTGGTVFGDSTARSDSISHALDIVAKNSTTDLSYSAAMLRSLQNLEAALAGVTNSVIRTVSPAQVSGLGTRQTISWDPFAIFMKTTKAITDWGIGAFPQMLKDILSSGFEGKTFTDITTTTKFFGMTLSSSTKTMIGDMASETEKQFTLAFRSIADTVREASKAFGTSSDEFNKMVETFVVKLDTTSLKGLKGKDLEDAIQQQFSKIADQIAGALNIQGLEEFTRVGEGAFETLVRVADGINTANAELEALGINAIKYSEIQFKQGDVAAEIIRQSIVAFEGLNSGIGSFMDQAVGSAQDLIETYQDLLQSRDIMKGLNLGWQDLNRTMTDAAGGVSKLLESLQAFRDGFYNEGEQLATSQVGLAREFGNLGLVLPESKDQFRALAESIDTSTASGAELFARVIKLSDAFASAADKADELEKKYKSYTDPFASFKDQINQVLDDFESILSGRLGGIEAKYANQAALEKSRVNGPLQTESARLSGIMSTREGEVAQEYAYIAQAQARITELQDMVNRAMASGNSRLAGYVRSWMSEMDDLNAMIGTLNSDIAAKTADINNMNRQIADLQAQIAQNSADIDTGQLSDKLKELTRERDRILRQEGNALVQTMQDIWDQVVGVIEDAQRSLARQIAELKGQRALVRNSAQNERDALSDLRSYQKAGGKDPQKTVQLVTSAQEAIMQQYNDRLELLTKQLERATREQERAIKKDFRAQEKEVRVQLRVDTREINRQLRIDTRAVQQDANQRIRAIERAGDQAVKAYQRQVDAQIEAINAAEQAATRALEDSPQAQQDALQEQQDARMQALQDALQDQLSTAQQLQSAYKQIADYAKNLQTGGLSSLSPEAKLAEAERQYQELLAKAKAGDAEAAGKVSGAADTYLQLKRGYEGSGTAYDAAYRQVLADMQGLGGMTAQVDPIQTAIEQLQTSQENELEALRKSQEAESKALQKTFQAESRALSRSQQDAMSALQKTFQDRIDRVNETAHRIENKMGRDVDRQVNAINRETDRTINKLEKEAQRQINHAERIADRQIAKLEREQTRAINALTDPNKNEAIKALKERTINKLERLDAVLVNAKEKAAEQARKQIDYLKSLNILNARQLEQLDKIGTATNAGTTTIPAYAAGGRLSAGLATIAEQGIEPIWFDRGGRVLSNSEARSSLTQADDKVVAKLDELRVELKSELVAIVRQAAAAYPRMVEGVERLADTTDKATRLAKSRPVAKA